MRAMFKDPAVIKELVKLTPYFKALSRGPKSLSKKELKSLLENPIVMDHIFSSSRREEGEFYII
jgi:hypothetical protein